jgi:hypothetical protein
MEEKKTKKETKKKFDIELDLKRKIAEGLVSTKYRAFKGITMDDFHKAIYSDENSNVSLLAKFLLKHYEIKPISKKGDKSGKTKKSKKDQEEKE